MALLFLVVILLLNISLLDANNCCENDWAMWKTKHNRHFVDPNEESQQQAQFFKNMVRIEAHNNATEEPDFLLSLNKFADLNEDEFARVHLGLVSPNIPQEVAKRGASTRKPEVTTTPIQWGPILLNAKTTMKKQQVSVTTVKTTPKPKLATTVKAAKTQSPPSSLDWRLLGAVSPVQDQGACAGCWAFSTAGVLEGRLKIKSGKLIALSEQNLLDCSHDGNSGCSGGWMENAYEYVEQSQGLNTAASYPYKATTTNTTCKFNPKQKYGAISKSTPYFQVPPNSEAAMIEALQTGPVSIAFDSSSFTFQTYSSGIYSDLNCSANNVNHAMLIVGYGTDPIKHQAYWIVKNSFGTDWGEKGYMRVARGSNMCGILSYGSYPILA